MWMGWVTLISRMVTRLQLTKAGDTKLKNGALKIILHHSSLPYNSG